jgi:ribosomal protein S27E
MILNIWCDQCDDWIYEFTVGTNNIHCAHCNNVVVMSMTDKGQSKDRIAIAKAIWGLQ